mmetsp:Transcript_25153/g.38966  ORF Transcript_25153/g.38966 Transcript_25153/m.38966 type:complete len:269 (+) Transcript_25153:1564-2370(+)
MLSLKKDISFLSFWICCWTASTLSCCLFLLSRISFACLNFWLRFSWGTASPSSVWPSPFSLVRVSLNCALFCSMPEWMSLILADISASFLRKASSLGFSRMFSGMGGISVSRVTKVLPEPLRQSPFLNSSYLSLNFLVSTKSMGFLYTVFLGSSFFSSFFFSPGVSPSSASSVFSAFSPLGFLLRCFFSGLGSVLPSSLASSSLAFLTRYLDCSWSASAAASSLGFCCFSRGSSFLGLRLRCLFLPSSGLGVSTTGAPSILNKFKFYK